MEEAVSERIAMLRFLMICGIVILHTPDYVNIKDMGPGLFDMVKAFFQSAVFRATVPVLTCISGYLLFRTALDKSPEKLYRKKLRTIGIPFIAFNALVLAGTALLQSLRPVPLSYQLIPFDAWTWTNAMLGLTDAPINYPLNFLRDLLVIFALTPVFGWLIRNAPIKGMILVSLIFFSDLDGMLVLRSSMPLLFYVGGMAAVYRWDMCKLDRFAWPCAALFVLLCASVIAYRMTNLTYLHVLSPLLVWPAASLVSGTAFGRWSAKMSKYAFFIFLAHAPLLSFSWLLYENAGGAVPYPVYWFVTPFITIALLIALYRVAQRHFPTVFFALMGERLPARRSPTVPRTL